MPQRGRRPEAAALRDVIDGKRGVFEQFTRRIDPRPRDPVRRAQSGRRPKPAHEGAFAHGRQARQFADAPGLAGPLSDLIQKHRQRFRLPRFALAVLDRSLQELRLAAVAMWRNAQSACHLVGDRRTVIATHEMQAKIESRGAAGGGQNAAFVHVQYVRIDTNRGVPPLKRLGVPPVSRCPPAVEQPGGSKHERARTDGQQPRTARMCAAQRIEYRLRHGNVDALPSWDHDGAGSSKRSKPFAALMRMPYCELTLRPLEQVSKRYQSGPSSGLASPNTSAAQENSKAHRPS